jgi:hypothetical protein
MRGRLIKHLEVTSLRKAPTFSQTVRLLLSRLSSLDERVHDFQRSPSFLLDTVDYARDITRYDGLVGLEVEGILRDLERESGVPCSDMLGGFFRPG